MDLRSLALFDNIAKHPWSNRRFAEYYRWYPKQITFQNSDSTQLNDSCIEGIYIHIPYCQNICRFCPFNRKVQNDDEISIYVRQLCKELALYHDQGIRGEIKFIYFGGGTPSVLNISQIDLIVNQINNLFGIKDGAEVSLEAHPTHVSNPSIQAWKKVGINRISTGIQSFSQTRLESLGATHNSSDSWNAVTAICENIDNSGIDLLYRCEGQSLLEWENELETFCKLGKIPHISLYSLYLPDDSRLPDENTNLKMAILANQILHSNHYEHYASCATGGFDFAKNGRKCVYEERHWGVPQAPYLAVGAGAIGYVDQHITINLHGLGNYLSKLEQNKLPLLSHTPVSLNEEKRRFFVLGVKNISIDLNAYNARFKAQALDDFDAEINMLVDLNLALVNDQTFQLTDIGRFYIDQISEIFWSKDESLIPHPETDEMTRLENRLMRA